MLQVVEINTIEQLESIRLQWRSLLFKTPSASLFHTLEWLRLYWRHVPRGQRLRVVVVLRGTTVLGILPLVVREEVTESGSVDVLTFPTINGRSLCGPVGPNPTATLMASFRHLADTSRDWEMISVADIGEHDRGRTSNAMKLAGFCPFENIPAVIPKVCIDQGCRSDRETEFVERTRDIKLELKLKGKLTFDRIRPPGNTYGDEEVPEAIIEACSRMNPQFPSTAMFQDLVRVAHRVGMLDLNLLKLDDRLIAFSLNVHFDGTLQQLCVGESMPACTWRPLPAIGVISKVDVDVSVGGVERSEPPESDVVKSLRSTTVTPCPLLRQSLTHRMLCDSVRRKDRSIYLVDTDDRVTGAWTVQRVRLACHRYRDSLPVRNRLARFGRWLTRSRV